MRYQFYREHKYVSAALNDLERLIAKTDFRNAKEVAQVDQTFQSLQRMLKAHAHYENDRLHALLRDRQSQIYEEVENDHVLQDEKLLEIEEMIQNFSHAQTDEERIAMGYKLYLTYRKFVADNLAHLYEEETVILPELQRLYSDEELAQVEAPTYKEMSGDEMVEMMHVLFPHMNPSDRLAFLSDIKNIQPEKFLAVWNGISPTLAIEEQKEFSHLQEIFTLN